jgi:hypothetical protein
MRSIVFVKKEELVLYVLEKKKQLIPCVLEQERTCS